LEPALAIDVLLLSRQAATRDGMAMAGSRRRAAMANRSEESGFDTSGRSAASPGESVRQLGDQMRDAMASLIEEQKERMAAAVHGFAQTLRQTAATLERDAKPAAEQYADQAAVQIDRLSARVRDQRWQDMVAQLQGFARRQPQLFLTGAVAAGFVVGRLLAQPDAAPPAPRVGDGDHMASGDALQPADDRDPGGPPLAGYGAGSRFQSRRS